ncbi:hypothetical protein FQR65_LT16296 [Abscondita terminalis]|nr:hypothetical protein FQR65_LT16296 [Abscondita terminalis]
MNAEDKVPIEILIINDKSTDDSLEVLSKIPGLQIFNNSENLGFLRSVNKGLKAIECDTRERQMLSKRMGKCDWYIQIDSDEYIIDIQKFVNQLKKISLKQPKHKISVAGKIVMLFKENDNELYIVNPIKELIWLATNSPDYQYARANLDHKLIKTDTLVVHQSWARSETEISQKISKLGHILDFDVNHFFELEILDRVNYKTLEKFHSFNSNEWEKWQKLKAILLT